jgi:hypothetical protein
MYRNGFRIDKETILNALFPSTEKYSGEVKHIHDEVGRILWKWIRKYIA